MQLTPRLAPTPTRPDSPLGSSGHSRRRLLAGLAGVALLSAGMAHAQAPAAYPDKPVRLIVSYAAGNVTDLLARIIAERLSEKWGQPVTVDNRPGQGGSLGAQLAVKSPNDGYTLLFSAMAALAINPHVYANIGYDASKDLAPIINVAMPSFVMVTDPSLKIAKFSDLLAYSKANPTALNYGTAGNGTVPHLNMEALKLQTGLMAQHVPYKAAPAVTTDLIAGRIQIQMDALSVVLPHIQSGRVTALAAGTSKRLAQLPDTPSISEVLPGYTPVVPWLGIFAPAKTSAAIINKIHQDVAAILQQPQVQERFAANALIITGEGPEAFGKLLAFDHDRLGKLVKQLNLKVD